MDEAVELIQDAKGQAFEALGACRKHDRTGTVLVEAIQQPRDILRAVLTIRVHDYDSSAGPIFVHINQSHRDGALVSQVPAETQDVDSLQRLEPALAKAVRRGVR